MPARYLLLLFLVHCSFALRGQITLQSCVRDITLQTPLSQSNISIKGTEQGTSTQQDGCFSIKVQRLPITLLVSHIGYKSIEVTVDSTLAPILYLESRSVELKPFTVTQEALKNISVSTRMTVTHFTADSNRLWVTGKRGNKHWLALMNTTGDTLALKSLGKTKPERFYTDCLNNIHLFTKEGEAIELFYGKEGMQFINTISIDSLFKVFKECELKYAHYLILKSMHYENQMALFSAYNIPARERLPFVMMQRKSGIHFIQNLGAFIKRNNQLLKLHEEAGAKLTHFDNTETEVRYQMETKFPPVYTPLIEIEDTLYGFNHPEGYMLRFDEQLQLLDSIRIDYQLQSFWKQQLLFDHITHAPFVVGEEKGYTTLYQLNTKLGELENAYFIGEYKFIQQPALIDRELFFIYNDPYNPNDITSLYRLPIDLLIE